MQLLNNFFSHVPSDYDDLYTNFKNLKDTINSLTLHQIPKNMQLINNLF